MPAGGAIEPVAAIFTLGVRQPLPAFALGTLAIHLAVGHILVEQQPAPGARFCIAPVVRRLAVRRWTNKNRFAVLAPVLALRLFLTDRTLFHRSTLLV